MWIYQNQQLSEPIEGMMGFVYEITELSTGKKYIGKKLFWKPAYRKIKGKRKKYLKESDWQTYYGSSKALTEQIEKSGVSDYSREILKICKTKGELSYHEAKLQFENDVLLRDDYYNGIISCRINKNHIRHMWHENV